MEKKIGENDKAIFYTNSFCKDWDDGYKMIIAEQKSNKYKEYILLEKGEPVYSSQDFESIAFRHDILKLTKV